MFFFAAAVLAAPPPPRAARSKPLYWNPPGTGTDSRDHTNAPKCDLPAVLAQAGVRANELVTNIQNFTAQERIEGLALSGDDRAAATGFAIACFIMLR